MKSNQRKYILIAVPGLLLIFCFVCIPFVNALRLGLYKWNGYSQNMKFVGLDNFEKLVTDKVFWRSLFNTMIYGFGSTLLQNVGGLAIALFLNKKFCGRNAVRAIVYVPIMISAFLMGQIVYYFIQYEGGVFNEILGMCGLEPVYWMKTGWRAVLMITLVNSWQYLGLCMVIYLAGLQNIPAMYQEAAMIDGAGKWKMFKKITLPLLIPSITTAVVTNLINGFKMFDVIASMSGGGPNRESMSLSYYISTLYFNDEKAGYSSALGIISFLVIMVIAFPVNAYLRKKEVEY